MQAEGTYDKGSSAYPRIIQAVTHEGNGEEDDTVKVVSGQIAVSERDEATHDQSSKLYGRAASVDKTSRPSV